MDDETDLPIAQAIIEVQGIAHNVTTTSRGEFWRLLVPGQTYQYRVHEPSYQSSEFKSVLVPQGGKKEMEVVRMRRSSSSSDVQVIDKADVSQPEVSTLSPEGFINKPEYTYHHYQDLTAVLHFYARKYRHIARLYSIGKSVQDRELWVMEISDNPGRHEGLEPGKDPIECLKAMLKNACILVRVQVRGQHAWQRGCRKRNAGTVHPTPLGGLWRGRQVDQLDQQHPDPHHAQHESGWL